MTIKPSVHASVGLDGSDGENVYLDSYHNPVHKYIPYNNQVVLVLGISDGVSARYMCVLNIVKSCLGYLFLLHRGEHPISKFPARLSTVSFRSALWITEFRSVLWIARCRMDARSVEVPLGNFSLL